MRFLPRSAELVNRNADQGSKHIANPGVHLTAAPNNNFTVEGAGFGDPYIKFQNEPSEGEIPHWGDAAACSDATTHVSKTRIREEVLKQVHGLWIR